MNFLLVLYNSLKFMSLKNVNFLLVIKWPDDMVIKALLLK